MTIGDIKSGGKEPWHRVQLALYVNAAPSPGVRFDEEEHRYFLGDRELPSVTRIANPDPSPFYHKGSEIRGKMVHRMCVLEAQGVLDGGTVDDKLLGYLEAWKRFRAEIRPEFLDFERVVCDEREGYAGRCDLVMKFCDGERDGLPGLLIYLRKTGRYSLEVMNWIEYREKLSEGLRLCRELRERGERLAKERELWA